MVAVAERTLTVGSHGPDVLEWHRELLRCRLVDVVTDGYGEDTAVATRSWQQLHGLPVTGEVGDAERWLVAARERADAAAAAGEPEAAGGGADG